MHWLHHQFYKNKIKIYSISNLTYCLSFESELNYKKNTVTEPRKNFFAVGTILPAKQAVHRIPVV